MHSQSTLPSGLLGVAPSAFFGEALDPIATDPGNLLEIYFCGRRVFLNSVAEPLEFGFTLSFRVFRKNGHVPQFAKIWIKLHSEIGGRAEVACFHAADMQAHKVAALLQICRVA